MNEPKLRFKADDGSQFPDWEEKKLSDIFVERREMQCIDDEYKLLSFTIEQGVINPEDKKTNKRDFLMKDKVSKKFLRTEYDDIIYNPANLKYGAINRNKLGKGLLSPIYAIFYTEQNAVFMESVVRNPDFIKRSLKYLEGTVIKLMTLKPRDFLRIKSYIPSLPEQQKIADFLSTIDTVIEKQQATVSAWEERKKGVMQKLFSQEVRFKADDGSDFPDWEEKRLEDVVEFLDEKRKPLEAGKRVAGKYPYYGASGIIDYVEDYIFDEELILLSEDGANILDRNYRVCFLAKGKYWVNNHAHVMKAKKGNLNYFICEELETFDYRKYNSGGAQPKLNQASCRSIVVKIPSLPEQQKIADFLSALDTVIQKQKETLEKWQELKKGLLQQMFV